MKTLALLILLCSQEVPLGNEPLPPGSGPGGAKADHVPYPSSWFPAQGRDMLAALESFSGLLAGKLGFNPRLNQWEMFRHYVGPDSPIRPKYEAAGVTNFGWWGHCNGSSACSVSEKEPPVSVTRNGVTIPADQLKGLLAEAYYDASALSKGMRSFLSESSYTEAKNLLETNANNDAWRAWYKKAFGVEATSSYGANEISGIARRGITRFEDMSPADFHRALRTVIGKAKIPMVIETSAGDTVWNYPAYEYKTNITETGRTLPGGLKVYEVTTDVSLQGPGTKTYTYELHVDGSGRIRGGTWTGNSVTNHPDFVWSPIDPQFRLNEIMAEAITRNIGFDFKPGEVEAAVARGDRAALKKLKGSINEVMSKAAPTELEPTKLTQSTYRKTVDLARQWNADPSLRYQFGDFETYLQSKLALSYGRGRKFNVDLYKELAELLPNDHRAVDDVRARLEKAAADPAPMRDKVIQSVKQNAKREAAGLAQFAAAYLLKETFKAIETRDPKKMKDAALQLKEPAFWGSLAVFTLGSRVAEKALMAVPANGAVMGLARAAVPLAVGMAAVQIMTGHASVKDVLVGTGAYLATGLAVNLLADSLIYPVLFAAGPPGWIAAGAYTVVKLAVTLYLGEKLEGWLHGLFDGGGLNGIFGGGPPKREGVKQKIDSLIDE